MSIARASVIKKALVSEAFALAQPDRGDAFSWLDDHADVLALAIEAAIAPWATDMERSCNTAWRINRSLQAEINELRKAVSA